MHSLGASIDVHFKEISKMEEPLFEFKNCFRNILTIGLWLVIFLSSFQILEYFKEIDMSSLWFYFFLVLISTLLALFPFWPIKLFKTIVYHDVIVFKEMLRHPILKNEFGIAFENINDYKIKTMIFNLNWIVIKRKNGRTIRRLFSFSARELKEFSNILNEKVKKN
ncbi:hypothetical protein TBC1_112168 [Lentimicrobium saccharophilum]|uniref:Uncharacterized protein n=2 Tax=Lentimicrobium saccharophilum TaxID=1678841 RepID=A0A0S7C4F2_9BACT|nr:hypothetical protein TBC1_112168 [Lentimicrobium saccharophilum]